MNQKTICSSGRRLTDRVRKRAKSVRKVGDFSNTFGGPSRAVLLVPAKSNRALENAGPSKARIRPQSARRSARKPLCDGRLRSAAAADKKCLTLLAMRNRRRYERGLRLTAPSGGSVSVNEYWRPVIGVAILDEISPMIFHNLD